MIITCAVLCVLNIGYISRSPPSGRIAHNVPFFFSYVCRNNEEKISKWFFLPFIQSGICSKKAAVDCYDSYSSIPGRSSSISIQWSSYGKSKTNQTPTGYADPELITIILMTLIALRAHNKLLMPMLASKPTSTTTPRKKKNTIRTKHILFNENTIRNIERTFCVSHGCFSSGPGCLVFVKPLQAILIHWRFSWIFLVGWASTARPPSRPHGVFRVIVAKLL